MERYEFARPAQPAEQAGTREPAQERAYKIACLVLHGVGVMAAIALSRMLSRLPPSRRLRFIGNCLS